MIVTNPKKKFSPFVGQSSPSAIVSDQKTSSP